MPNFLKIISITLLFCNINNALSSEIFLLNPNSIKEELKKNPARIKEIENYFINSKISNNDILENFDPKLTGSYSYEKTKQSFQNFFPSISPYTNFTTAIEKSFQSGIDTKIGNISYRRKYVSNRPETRNALFFKTSIDLYKNFFGKTSKSKVKNAAFQIEISDLQRQIDSKIFQFLVLKTYYDLVLNQESINISERLLKLSKKQFKDLQKKFKSKIADIDDVERQKIEVTTRHSKILSLKKEREFYLKQLRRQLPNLSQKKIKLSKYNYDQIERKFLDLTFSISSKISTPKEYSLYDEILVKEKQSYQMQKKINSTYSDIDVKLNAEIQKFDGNNSLSDSYDNISSNKDSQYYSVGAEIVIPLGRVKKNNERLKIKSSHLSYLTKKEKLLSELDSYHLDFVNNSYLLRESLKNQTINVKSSEIILNESRKKYKQARISLQRLIDDQNMLLETSLTKIAISRQFLDLIFNYLTIFTLLDV
jgi:outer membrane protein TolC